MTSTTTQTQLQPAQSTLPIAHLQDKLSSAQAEATPAANSAGYWSVKESALQALSTQGLPNGKKLERWKYSPLHLVWQQDYLDQFLTGEQKGEQALTEEPPATEGAAAPAQTSRDTWQPDTAITLPLKDGRCLPADLAHLSETPGLLIQGVQAIEDETLGNEVNKHLTALAQADGLCATTLALTPNTLVITITDDFDVSRPLVLKHEKTQTDTATADYSTVVIRLAQHQKLTLIEQYAADANCLGLKTVLSLIDLAPGARCNHLRLMSGTKGVQQHFYTRITLAGNSQYHGGNYSIGPGFIRSVIEPQLTAPSAHCQVSGAYLACAEAHHDHRIFVDHLAPHCTSQSFVKGIAGQGGTAVFNGRIHIAPGAKQSDGALQNRNLLLDNKSTIHTKPELEIYNDDVKCSHGATVSQLDHQQLLYLQSRGLAPEAAVHLLLESYLLETLGELPENFANSGYLKKWLTDALSEAVPEADAKEITA